MVGDKEQDESEEEAGHSHVEGGCHVSAIGEGALRIIDRVEDCVGQHLGGGLMLEVEELEAIAVDAELVEVCACQRFGCVFEHDVEDVESDMGERENSFLGVFRDFVSETAGR